MNLTGKMSARAWILTSLFLFFAIALISLIPLFAAHVATVSEPINNTWIKNGTQQSFNFNVTFDTSSVDNITSINVSAPPGFSISSSAPLSSIGGFSCTSAPSLVNCTGLGLGNDTLSLIIQVNATPQTTTATYTWIVNTTDAAGSVNGYSTTAKVDAEAPTVAAPTVNVSSPTKLNTNFFINTSYTDPNTGSGISACSYNVTNSTGGLVVSASAVSSGGITGVANATISATLPDGANSIYMNCSDSVGWVGYSTPTTLTVDTAIPTCSALASNDSFARTGDSINFTATCTDAGVGIASVFLNLTSVNASAIVQALPSGGNTYSAVILANAIDGQKTVYILNVTDSAGNTNSSLTPTATLVVDSTNPIVVASATKYPGIQTWARNGNAVTLNATVTDTPAGVYSVLVNGSSISASESIPLVYDGANYINSTVVVGDVLTGSKSLLVTAIDNSSNANNTIFLTVLVDNSNPLVSGFSATDYTVKTGDSVNFSAVVTDAGSGLNLSSAFVLNSTGGMWPLTTTDGENFTGPVVITEAEGTYQYNFTISDNVSNTNTTQSLTILVDNTAPAVTPRATLYPAAQTAAKVNQYVNVNVTVDASSSGLYTLVVNASALGLADSIPLVQQGSSNNYNTTLLVNTSATTTVVLSIIAVDNSSNMNSTESFSVVVDNTNPAVTALPTKYPGVQTWAKTGNMLTLNATVTDSPAGVYSVLVNGSQIGASESIPLLFDGTNYVNATVVVVSGTSGQKNLTVTATDNASNTNTTSTITVLVDNTNPTVSAFTVNDSTVQTGWTVFFTAIVSDLHSGINASSVFVLNSTGATTLLSSSDGSTFNGSVVITEPEGIYLYNLTVSDNVSNTNTTQSVTILVDNTAPAVTPRATIYPAAQTAAKVNQYVNVNVTVDGSIAGLASVSVNASALGLADSIPLVQQGSSNNYNATLLVNTSTTSTAYLQVTAIDNSNNINSTTLLAVIVDNTNPTVAALPTAYPGVQTWAKTGQTITLNATISDVGSDVYSATVNGSQIGASESIPLVFNGASYVNSTVLIGSSTTGAKNLTVTATDNASNTNTTSTITVLVDNTNPVVSYLAVNDSTIRTGDSVAFIAAITDADSGVNASSVAVFNSTGAANPLTQVSATNFSASITITESADGTYQYNLTVLDNVTNANTTQYVTLIVDNTNPAVSAGQTAYPAGQTYAKYGDNVTLNATVSDNLAGLASVTVNASALGLSSTLTLSGSGAEKTATVTVNTTNAGTVTLLVTAIDNSGNANATIPLPVNIDSTNPAVTANSPTYPGIQTWARNGQSIVLNATVTDTSVKNVTANASALGGSATLPLMKAGASDNYNNTLTISGVASDGTRSLLVTATDNANNINNTISLSVNVDATAPAVTITSPANAANLSGTNTVTLTVNDTSSGVNVSSIVLYINNSPVAPTCTNLGTFANCSFPWDTTLVPDGAYIINATALDNATNPGASTQITATVDNTAPSLTVNSPIGGQTITDTLNVNASVSDTRLNSSSCQYRIVNASSTLVGWTALTYSSGYCLASLDTKTYPTGALNVSVRISDNLGNQNSSTAIINSVAAVWVNSATATKSSAYTTGSDYLEYIFNVTLKGGTRVKLKLSPLTDGTHTYTPEGQTTITASNSTYNVQQNYTDSTGIIPDNGLFTLRYTVPGGMVAGAYTANYGVGLYS